MSINKVVISGNLTRDSEIRSTQSGMNILTFGVAVNDRRRNSQTGEWEDYANFVDCVLFGNRADFLSRVLHKGTKVMVEGKLRYSSWERDGQRRSKIEVVVDDVDFFSPRSQGQQPQQPYDNGQRRYGNGGQYNNGGQYGNGGQPQPFNAPTPSPAAPVSAPVQESVPVQNQGYTSNPAQQMPPDGDVYDEDIPF